MGISQRTDCRQFDCSQTHCIEHVLEHLWKLGHRHVDCINTQNHNAEIDRRIDIWKRWISERELPG